MSVTTVDQDELGLVHQRSALLSIKPHYVDAILRGAKTIELRRKPPSVVPGSTIFLYSTSPTSQLVGTAILGRTISARPAEFWRSHARFTGVDRATFDEYFEGAELAHGLQVHTAMRAHSPLSLTRMREVDMSPPQSWRYVDSLSASLLLKEMQMTVAVNAQRSALLTESIQLIQGVVTKLIRGTTRRL